MQLVFQKYLVLFFCFTCLDVLRIPGVHIKRIEFTVIKAKGFLMCWLISLCKDIKFYTLLVSVFHKIKHPMVQPLLT